MSTDRSLSSQRITLYYHGQCPLEHLYTHSLPAAHIYRQTGIAMCLPRCQCEKSENQRQLEFLALCLAEGPLSDSFEFSRRFHTQDSIKACSKQHRRKVQSFLRPTTPYTCHSVESLCVKGSLKKRIQSSCRLTNKNSPLADSYETERSDWSRVSFALFPPFHALNLIIRVK